MEGIIYSTIAGLSTLIGASIVLLLGKPKNNLLAIYLGFAGGIMLAVSVFELIPEAIEFASLTHGIIGLLVGFILMAIIDRSIPHYHISEKTMNNDVLRTGYFVVLGIALHNLPEGLAIGAGLEVNPTLSLYIAISIGLHNIPEGMATAAPLRGGGLHWTRIILLNLIAGLMTPLGALIGLIFFNISPGLVGFGLSFAAGAMIYIVVDELMPQSFKHSKAYAYIGLLIGVAIGYFMFS